MMPKKKPTPKPSRGPGHPRKYPEGSAIKVLIQMPTDLLGKLDKRAKRLGIKRTEAAQLAITAWLDTPAQYPV